jgi:hypothetical protein
LLWQLNTPDRHSGEGGCVTICRMAFIDLLLKWLKADNDFWFFDIDAKPSISYDSQGGYPLDKG